MSLQSHPESLMYSFRNNNAVIVVVTKHKDKMLCSYEGGSESSVIGVITLLIYMIGCCIIH